MDDRHKNIKRNYLILSAVVILFGLVIGVYSQQTPTQNLIYGKTSHGVERDNQEHGTPAEQANPEVKPTVDMTNKNTIIVTIKDYKFTDQVIKVKKGTTVMWINQDTVEHNAMREHEDGEVAHNAPGKDKVRPDVFEGPLLAKGESYSFTFHEVGIINYHCAPHPSMRGIVEVVN